jgi:hypothetical protein
VKKIDVYKMRRRKIYWKEIMTYFPSSLLNGILALRENGERRKDRVVLKMKIKYYEVIIKFEC